MRFRLAIAATLLAAALPAAAAEPPGLIKLPDDGNPATQEDTAVYYLSPEGGRFAFPNAGTFFSWYPDFKGVKTVTAAEMAAIPLKGNVTYKPGARLLKIATDPKVYVVSRGSRLRHVASEAVASALYGSSWGAKVSDVADVFFSDYSIGAAVSSAADYDPVAELAIVSSIADDVSYRAAPQAPGETPAPTPQPAPPPPKGGGKLSVDVNKRAHGTVAVRGQAAVELVAFDFTATNGPVRLTGFTVQGYIDEQESLGDFLPGFDADNGSPTYVNRTVAEIELADERGVRLAGPVPVDFHGRAAFSGLDLPIGQDVTRTVIVRGTISKDVDIEAIENLLAFDIPFPSTDIAAFDGLGAVVTVTDPAPNGDGTPESYVHVRASGRAEITWSGLTGVVTAGREQEIGVLTIAAKDDDLELRAIGIRSVLIDNNGSFLSLRLAYPGPDGRERSAEAPYNGLQASFVGLQARVPRGGTLQLRLLAPLRTKAEGAKSGERIELQVGRTDALEIVSLASGTVLDEGDIGTWVALNNSPSRLTVRYAVLTLQRAADTPQGEIRRTYDEDVFRFVVRTSPEGGARLRTLTFKLEPSDVGTIGPDNDALEAWADQNGDFADDNDVINLYMTLDGVTTKLAEGPEARVRYGIVKNGTLDPTPQGLESAAGDYGQVEVAFDEGGEPFIPAGKDAVFTLELDTYHVAPRVGNTERTLETELLGADAFRWTDRVSGFYEPLDGYSALGLPVTAPALTVK